jgi:hypothetical protein
MGRFRRSSAGPMWHFPAAAALLTAAGHIPAFLEQPWMDRFA